MRRHSSVVALLALACGCASAPRGALPPQWPLRADTLQANGWERDCDLLHLSLDVALDYDAGRVYGSATSWVRALAGGCRSVTLHAVELDVHEVEDSRGRKLDFELADPHLTIHLAEALVSGEEERLRVTYAARPAAGLFFTGGRGQAGFAPELWTLGRFEENRHWFPAWDYPSDRTTFDGRFRVGHDMWVVSNGELVGVREEGAGERTFHWRMGSSIPTHLVGAAAGRFETYEDRAGDLPLHYHVPPGTGEERARALCGETPAMLAFFSELLGRPYPYAKYDQAVVQDPSWPGGGSVTLTLLPNELLAGDPGNLALDGGPRHRLAHGLAHNWFGGLVAGLGWSHFWLNEAWASYLAIRWERECQGEGHFRLRLEHLREEYLRRDAGTRAPLALDWRSQGASPVRANHVHDKGPWVLHMLERELGEEAFWAAVRAYLTRHADDLVTTEDFARVVFDTTGRNVEGFLEQWVYGGGHPVLEVGFDRVDGFSSGPFLGLIVEQVQEFDALVPLFDLRLAVDLHYADGEVQREWVRIDARLQILPLPLAGELVDVVFDAEAQVLGELVIDKPLEMWLHQVALVERPACQWRALEAVWEAAGESDAALLALLRLDAESPEPLLRQRAAGFLDCDERRARKLLQRRLEVEPSPSTRAQIRRLLGLPREGQE